MGILYKKYLTGPKVLCCEDCRTHIATHESIISKSFQGQHGKAYLMKQVTNIAEGILKDRPMTTGLHSVRDITCIGCQAVVGWKYEHAYEDSQKYKEGRFIIERNLMNEVEEMSDEEGEE